MCDRYQQKKNSRERERKRFVITREKEKKKSCFERIALRSCLILFTLAADSSLAGHAIVRTEQDVRGWRTPGEEHAGREAELPVREECEGEHESTHAAATTPTPSPTLALAPADPRAVSCCYSRSRSLLPLPPRTSR